jgi:adenylate cyclase
MLELRVAISLFRHERSRGRAASTRRIADIYARFSEGFETSDLREARALLEAQP